MILIGYRHGLRASELCDLRWSQVELATGRLHVRRAKNGSPSVHPMQGDEIRALGRLQREQGPSIVSYSTFCAWRLSRSASLKRVDAPISCREGVRPL
jgi:integrase